MPADRRPVGETRRIRVLCASFRPATSRQQRAALARDTVPSGWQCRYCAQHSRWLLLGSFLRRLSEVSARSSLCGAELGRAQNVLPRFRSRVWHHLRPHALCFESGRVRLVTPPKFEAMGVECYEHPRLRECPHVLKGRSDPAASFWSMPHRPRFRAANRGGRCQCTEPAHTWPDTEAAWPTAT